MSLYTNDIGINGAFDISVDNSSVTELVSLSDIKTRMNQASDEFDTVFARQLTAVRANLEMRFNRTFCKTKTITTYLHDYGLEIPLPYPPIASVTSVTQISKSDSTDTTLLTVNDNYTVLGVSNKRILMNSMDSSCGLQIVYVASETDTDRQALIADAMISEIMQWFNGLPAGNQEYKLGEIAAVKLWMFK